jgi:hypothetical protein
VVVRDRNGRLIPNLSEADFDVTDDGDFRESQQGTPYILVGCCQLYAARLFGPAPSDGLDYQRQSRHSMPLRTAHGVTERSGTGSATFVTAILNEGLVFEATEEPPVFSGTAPSHSVELFAVAILKMVTVTCVHGLLS